LDFWVNQQVNQQVDHQALFEQSRAVMLAVQGRGSGADLAAAIEGGMVQYQLSGERHKFEQVPDIGLYFCGYKLTTPEVLRRVAEAHQQQPALYDGLYRLMSQCADQACHAAGAGDWQQLGLLMNIYQGLMDALGVNDAKLSQMIYALRQADRVLGAKISGSGLGDCVISLGRPVVEPEFEAIAVCVCRRGVEVG
jgi:mevalonate kinase